MTPIVTVLVMMALFQAKHLLADYYWQTMWMIANKGRYGHPGGIVHAALHAMLTAPILLLADIGALLFFWIVVIEFAVHYNIDWLKAHVIRRSGLGINDASFWNLLGLDQAAHQLTYVAILAVVFM